LKRVCRRVIDILVLRSTNLLEERIVDSRIEGNGSPNPAAEEVAGALARVEEAVSDVTTGELRESLEAAIETIDSSRIGTKVAENDKLAAVADALEGALDELEHGKVADLLPVIQQAQSTVATGSSGT
jgi:hypothetical protein